MPEQDLAVIIPTRGRPGNIRKVIQAWDFTKAWDHARMVLAVDADDPEYQGYVNLFEETRNPDTDESLFSICVQDTWVPMVTKLNRVAANLALTQRYFALAFAGDDHLPRTIGWAERYLTVLREMGTGMVYGDDGYQGKKLSTEWAVTSDAVRALGGRMVPAPVEHMYCDNSILELFHAAGAERHLPEIRIEHMNPYAGGKAELDPQYKRVNSRDQFARDGAAYRKWQRQQMASDVNALIALRPPNVYVPRRRTLAPTQRKARAGMSLAPRIFRNVRGATPDEIGVTLADFARQVPGDQAIVEIGVFQGRTALLMAWGARQGNGAHVWGIDPWDLEGNTYAPPFTDEGSKNWARYNVQATGHANYVTLFQAFSDYAAGVWDGPKIGLLFIDGDHSYEGARGDVLNWAPHLAPGAVIAIDDYGHPDWPGVAQAVDKLVEEGVLEPIERFHDALAVTRMAVDPPQDPAEHVDGAPCSDPWCDDKAQETPDQAQGHEGRETPDGSPAQAITSEGVSPSPVPMGRAETVAFSDVPPAVEPLLEPPVAAIENGRTREGELGGLPAGTDINSLNLGQLRSLARDRGIVLGTRKDRRELTIQAILDGV